MTYKVLKSKISFSDLIQANEKGRVHSFDHDNNMTLVEHEEQKIKDLIAIKPVVIDWTDKKGQRRLEICRLVLPWDSDKKESMALGQVYASGLGCCVETCKNGKRNVDLIVRINYIPISTIMML